MILSQIFVILFCLIGHAQDVSAIVENCTIIEISEPESEIPAMPAMSDMPLVLTNYWTYTEDEEGNLVLIDAWAGQCNEDCGEFANGVINRPVWIRKNAGCIDEWVGRWPHSTAAVQIPGYGHFVCNDTFGDRDYAAPRWHEDLQLWGIPVDLLIPEPTGSVVVYNYGLSSVAVDQEPPW